MRGFPVYQPLNDYYFDNQDKVFPFYDGIRITLYKLPIRDGLIWGKTDRVDVLERVSQYTLDFQACLEEDPNFNAIKHMTKELGDTYAISGILYGKETSSRKLPLYDIEDHRFIVTHIENIKTHEFLPYEQAKDLCSKYGVAIIQECQKDDKKAKEAGGILYQKYNNGELEYFTEINSSVKHDDLKRLLVSIWEGVRDFSLEIDEQLDLLFYHHVKELQLNDFLDKKDFILNELAIKGRKYDYKKSIHSFLYYHRVRNMAFNEDDFIEQYRDSYLSMPGFIKVQGEKLLKECFIEWKEKAGNEVTSREFVDLGKFMFDTCNVPNILESISTEFRIPVNDLKRINSLELKENENWHGAIPLSGGYKHTLLCNINTRPLIIRPFPEYQRSYSFKEGDQIFPCYNGTQLTLYTLPFGEGIFWGKTNTVNCIDRKSIYSTNYLSHLKEDINFSKIEKMVKELGLNYAINGILYGKTTSYKKKPMYSNDHRFIVTHIEDLHTHKFLSHEETVEICEKYSVDVIRECNVNDDIVNKTGGYVVKRYRDGEIQYFDCSSNNDININKLIFNKVWEHVDDLDDFDYVNKLLLKVKKQYETFLKGEK